MDTPAEETSVSEITPTSDIVQDSLPPHHEPAGGLEC